MYAVIKTGGKQYRVKAGDLLVVEKIEGEPGAKVRFDDVLMIGEGDNVVVGAPRVEGASVTGALIETRKGEKIKIFKKIRRQGYRRTRGHRQLESVVRVTALSGAGKSDKWDGQVDLTPRAELVARARGLARLTPAAVEVKTVADQDRDAVVHAAVVESAAPVAKAAPKAKAPAKAKAAPKTEAAPKAETKAKAAPKAKAEAAPKSEPKAKAAKAAAPKKKPAPKAPKA